jgi:hypothetical protein
MLKAIGTTRAGSRLVFWLLLAVPQADERKIMAKNIDAKNFMILFFK